MNHAQHTNTNDSYNGNRFSAYAGRFYPESAAQLEEQLTELFREAEPAKGEKTRAIVAPHAGYMFSGAVAASAFNQIQTDKSYSRIFVLASSHNYHFRGAAVYTEGNYVTPLGEIKVDRQLGKEFVKSSDVFRHHRDAHLNEHSLEVLLPFLQHRLASDFKMVPLILGTSSPDECREIAELLQPYFTEDNLFVVSTDFSHYPNYEDAVKVDEISAEAVCSNNPDTFLKVMDANRKSEINNLATPMCGWTSVLTLLFLTRNTDLDFKRIIYRNSGSVPHIGDKNRVVGYWAISVTSKSNEFSLSEEEKKTLIDNAKESISRYFITGVKKISPAGPEGSVLNAKLGAFVSLYVENELKGCIGSFAGEKTLNEVVQSCAVSATSDSRFEAIEPDEIKDAVVEISVLTPLRRIHTIEELEPGKHGVYVVKGSRSGTLLPQVARRTGWNRQELLGYCSHDKAGIGWNGWKNAEVYVYEAYVFKGT